MPNAYAALLIVIMIDLIALHEWTVYLLAPVASKRLGLWQLRLALVFAGGFTVALAVGWTYLSSIHTFSAATLAGMRCAFVAITAVLLLLIGVNGIRLARRARAPRRQA